MTGSGNAPALGSTLERVSLSHCELLHGSSELDAGVTAIRLEEMTRTGLNRSACRVLVGKPKENAPFGRPGSKWEVNIKMDLK